MSTKIINDPHAQLLEATLPHVPFDGWTSVAVQNGAADLGMDQLDVKRVFSGGPTSMISFYNSRADSMLSKILSGPSLNAMRVRDRVAAGVRARIEILESEKEIVRCTLSFLAMPQNLRLAMRCLHNTVDSIWRLAGDRALDWNYYSKRGLLAVVYTTTVLYWLEDVSEGSTETWAFLNRRIENVMTVPKVVARCRNTIVSPLSQIRKVRTV